MKGIRFSVFVKWLLLLLFCGSIVAMVLFYIMDRQQEPLEMDGVARKNAPGAFIPLSQGLTHYRLLGPEDGELLVLVHGGMVSGMYAWEKNYRFLLDRGFRVLLYDLYGRGYSDRVREEYTPELFFQQFHELLDSLQINEPFYLAGLSMGSMVAIDFAVKKPEKVKKLMLISPAARGKFQLHPALKVPVLSRLLMSVYWFPRAVDKQMQEFHQPQNFPEYEKKLREMIRYKGYKSSNYSTWLHTLTLNMEPQLKEIGRSRIPTALVLGAHDPYVPAEEAAIYQDLIPGIEVFHVPEAGHIVNYERADVFNRLMLQFLSSKTEAGSVSD